MKRFTDEEKAARRAARKEEKEAAKRAAKLDAIKNAPRVDHIEMNIEWKRSKTWGMNPHLRAWAHYVEPDADGSRIAPVFESTASGCGYDKLSTVVAACFNHFLKNELYRKTAKQLGKKPYGVRVFEETNNRYFEGGVGIECYRAIAEFIGGELVRVARGDSFDCFHFNKKGNIFRFN